MPFPKALPQFTAWSWSRFKTYRDCPLKAKLKDIDKIQEPPNSAMDRGTGIHHMAEAFAVKRVPEIDKRDGDRLVPYKAEIAKAAKGTLPTPLVGFRAQFAALRKVGPLTEQQWAFDVNWNPVSWFAREAWCRVKMDAHYLDGKKKALLPVIDYKTGKVYPEDGKLQMDLYGLAGLIMYPAVEIVLPALWYLDQPQGADNPSQHQYPRSMLNILKKQWEKRVAGMLSDKQFAPRPGAYCRWCFYRKSNTKNNGTGKQLCKY